MKSLVLTLMNAIILGYGINTVNAQTVNPVLEAKGFNVFTKNSVTLTAGDTHGPVATGGNLILNGTTILSMNSTGIYPNGANASNNYGLVIGGHVVFTAGGVSTLNQGYLRIGNTTGNTLFDRDNNNATTNLQVTSGAFDAQPRVQLQHYQDKLTATDPHNLNFNSAFSTFTNNANLMNSYASNSTTYSASIYYMPVPSGQNPQINIVNNKVNYLNLTEAQLSNLNNQGSVTFNTKPNATSPLIVNITLTNGTYAWSPPNVAGLNESDGAYIIYNFHNATNLTIGPGSNSVYGTVYAPGADITKSGGNNNNGQIIAKSLIIAYGEIHYQPFNGNIPNIPGTGGLPLPIKSIDLTGSYNNGAANLSWKVVAEQDVTGYTLERSTDAKNFMALTKVSSTGDTEEEKTYQETDSEPLTAPMRYYRVGVHFTNGTLIYSPVLKISNGNTVADAAVWPNPFQSKLYLKLPAAGSTIQVKVSDLSGKAVSNQQLDAAQDGAYSISLPAELHNGVYFLEVISADHKIILSKTMLKN